MRSAEEVLTINFVEQGEDVSGLIILDDGQVLEGSRNGSLEDGVLGQSPGDEDYGS